MAYNFAHDVALPASAGGPVGFLMYPQAETKDGRLDCLDADKMNRPDFVQSAGAMSASLAFSKTKCLFAVNGPF